MRQVEAFIKGEGDAWFERNREKLPPEHDPVAVAITYLGITPKAVLEIGCCDGWRLAKLREKYGCAVAGVEPSRKAAAAAADRKVPVWQAAASAMPVRSGAYDVVIYGFCLYLTDPADWFRIAMEGDRVLKDGGHLIIHDFANEGFDYARPYEHRDGVLSYHVDFSRLWRAHPWYRGVKTWQFADAAVSALQKNTEIEVRQ